MVIENISSESGDESSEEDEAFQALNKKISGKKKSHKVPAKWQKTRDATENMEKIFKSKLLVAKDVRE